MHLIYKQKKVFKLKHLVFLIILFCFSNCNHTNSDQLVQETLKTEQFNLELLNSELQKNSNELKERVITIKGIVKDINFLNNRNTIILRDTKDLGILAICDLQKNQEEQLKKISLGESVTIKGILKGSLNDIILLNCVINNSKSYE